MRYHLYVKIVYVTKTDMCCLVETEQRIARMSTVTLIFGEERFEVSLLSLCQSCDAPALIGVSSYRVKSSVPASIFQLFIEALNGTNIKITNEHVLSLSQLCYGFGF
jgi:hypothetical protein